MTRPLLHLPRWHRHLLSLAAGLLLVSGGLWLLVHYLWGAGAGELPHAWEAPLIRIHGGGAFLGLFTLGVLAGQHVPAGWRVTAHPHATMQHRALVGRDHRRQRQRTSGMILLVLSLGLVLSGYALYYLTPEDWRPAVGWMHAGLGTLLLLAGGWHARRRRSSHHPLSG